MIRQQNTGQSRSVGTGAGPHALPSRPEAPVPHYQEIADMLALVERERAERADDVLRRSITFDQET